MKSSSLLKKYNIAAPRYTSYPTVPYWQKEAPLSEEWTLRVEKAFQSCNEISLYIHLPFCEQLCTYCGCNKRITKNHGVEAPYVNTVLKEWQMYVDLLPSPPVIRELHLGGGTPTFFAPSELKRLIEGILSSAKLPSHYEFGFEAHPASTSFEHLKVLKELGFSRLSIGVQDFAPEILKIINRHQTDEQIERVTRQARELGYESINYDLIFGLPLQTKDHIRENIARLKTLRPDRLAFYSYAHVPWIKPSQRAYSEADLPTGAEKRALYELGCELLEKEGYVEIGMDHFALKSDSLYKAMEDGSLHRNFMGYTPFYTRLCIALGASSISDSWDAYIQNEKKIEDYSAKINNGEWPITRGHLLNQEDEILRSHILNLMCRLQTSWEDPSDVCDSLYEGLQRMDEFEKDGLIELNPFQLKVTPKGLPFIRNICMALDARYWRRKPEGQLFSQVV